MPHGRWPRDGDTFNLAYVTGKALRPPLKASSACGFAFIPWTGFRTAIWARNGWDKGYNFGSREKASLRWMAAIKAGVDFIAADQYEDVAALVRSQEAERSVMP